MNSSNLKSENGFALLIFVIVLMGMGGLLIAGYTQGILKGVEIKRFEHNKRVLAEAKQALLMFAYNYPELDVTGTVNGPGRLPCADIDNDGDSNTGFGDCITLGRLPWSEPNLNLYDIRDADGQRLWYAVSDAFATNVSGGNTINSDTSGTITVRDQSGNVIYDGSNPSGLAKYGVAAVIIAPGDITATQDRSIANGDDPFDTTADTDPGILSASNFLDLHSTENNANFIQDSSTNGFILGPVDNQGINAVNDQMIIITVAEVIEMAEKATLQAYKATINDYRNNIKIDTPGFDAYPWLDDYTTTDLTDFDGDVGTRIGRLPSVFGNYFAPAPDTSLSITSDLDLDIIGGLTVNGFAVPLLAPGNISSNAEIVFNADGDMLVTPSVSNTTVRYYWDEDATPDGWVLCPVNLGTERDCNQDDILPGVPNSAIDPNEVAIRVVSVTYADFTAGFPVTQLFAHQAATPGPFYQPPTAGNHARVFFQYSVPTTDAIVRAKYDSYYLLSFDPQSLGTTFNYKLGVKYYPELPRWAAFDKDDWHDSIQMAYSSGYQPGGASSCTPGTDCITVNNSVSTQNDKIAVLTLASEHGLQPDDGAAGYQDDLGDIFDMENDDLDDVFDVRAINGNDKILVIR